jgi:FMN phosphatase YigB (HAD superfamily)
MNHRILPFFDVYGTLLRFTPAVEPEKTFTSLWKTYLGGEPGFSWGEFQTRLQAAIADSHARDNQSGIAHPEVQWSAIVTIALGRHGAVDPNMVCSFAAALMACQRTITAMPGASELLAFLRERNVPCGIASNAQFYTPQEMESAGLSLDGFPTDLRVWSWEIGFAKPSPYFFQIMAARAARYGISRPGVLMIGDREDNDMTPARAAGFQTWPVRGPESLTGLLQRWDELF